MNHLYDGASVAQLDAPPMIRRLRVQPLLSRQHSFVEIDHKIFYMVILSLLMIQEGQLSEKNVHNTG